MADTSAKISQIFKMVVDEKCFTINKPRQYGKTTTLFLLEKKLMAAGYLVIRMSFEGIGDLVFEQEEVFSKKFLKLIADIIYPQQRRLSRFVMGKSRIVSDFEQLSEVISQIADQSGTNFDALIKNLENNPELDELTQRIILDGANISFVRTDNIISMGIIYGVFAERDGICAIHNRIYESLMYDHLMMKTARNAHSISDYNLKGNFIVGQKLDMEKILLKFQQFMKEQYSEKDTGFIEREGQLLFLAFLKPIINGYGFDFKDPQISEEKRLDIVVTFFKERYIVELKIWRGPQAHEKGVKQLTDYLERLNADRGYLIIYDLRKSGEDEGKMEKMMVDGREIFMVWV
jgi:hypothetical protein